MKIKVWTSEKILIRFVSVTKCEAEAEKKERNCRHVSKDIEENAKSTFSLCFWHSSYFLCPNSKILKGDAEDFCCVFLSVGNVLMNWSRGQMKKFWWNREFFIGVWKMIDRTDKKKRTVRRKNFRTKENFLSDETDTWLNINKRSGNLVRKLLSTQRLANRTFQR